MQEKEKKRERERNPERGAGRTGSSRTLAKKISTFLTVKSVRVKSAMVRMAVICERGEMFEAES